MKVDYAALRNLGARRAADKSSPGDGSLGRWGGHVRGAGTRTGHTIVHDIKMSFVTVKIISSKPQWLRPPASQLPSDDAASVNTTVKGVSTSRHRTILAARAFRNWLTS
jgi:hypothetical protein